ncbi:MAG: DUF1013 domain-containing protein [Alphaproteobacteria bacterium]|jgi:uncharacterized protein|nr:DUF1013 domain-containing protein [Alphaproteobacteria bacterium]
MAQPLMPKATAVWLVDSTTLSFEQIAAFCGLHPLEVQGVADGEVAVGIRGLDPVAAGQVTREEVERCEADPSGRLVMIEPAAEVPKRVRRARYTPVSKRQERPNGIAWLLKNYPELSDAQIGKLLGTTKATITAVRDRTHWNTQQISPQDPLLLGICGEMELVEALNIARRRQTRAAERKAKEEARRRRREGIEEPEEAVVAEEVAPAIAQPTTEDVVADTSAVQPTEPAAAPTAESVFGKSPSSE